jgi:hypothetical protein
MDHRTTRTTLEFQLDAVLGGRIPIGTFAAWWDRCAAEGRLDALTYLVDPGACKAVELCRLVLEDHRAGKLDDEDLHYLLGLARLDLRG